MARDGIRLRLLGVRDLRRELERLEPVARRRVIRPALNAAMTPVNKTAKRLVPKRSGQLRRAIGKKMVTASRTRTPNLVVGVVGPRTGFRAVIDGKIVDPTKYGHLVELGTEHSRAVPFLRRALDQEATSVVSIMAAKTRLGLAREAARARAKANGRRR